MDPSQWMQLADAGAAAIIGAMATDAWHGVRATIARLFEGSADRGDEAVTWIDQQRQALIKMPPPNRAREEAVLRAEVTAVLLRRIAEDPDTADRLDDVIAALNGQAASSVRQQATATFGGRVNQAGRDLTVPPATDR